VGTISLATFFLTLYVTLAFINAVKRNYWLTGSQKSSPPINFQSVHKIACNFYGSSHLMMVYIGIK